MKYFVLLVCLSWMGCVSKRKIINPDEIVKVYVLFKSPSYNNYNGYQLPDGKTIPYDIKHTTVKAALAANFARVRELPKGELAEIKILLHNSRHHKSYPIKVVPLRQFGYLETQTGKIIKFGITGKTTFIDLDNDRVYFSRD